MTTKIKHQRGLVFTMAIGIFLCMLDTTVMNIALPAIQSGLKTDLSHLSWALNIYTILFASLTIPLGRVADICGRSRIYLFGLALFLMGSVFSGLAASMTLLIVGRGIQSIGAAIVFPASMTIAIQNVSLDKRTGTIAILGVTQGLAAALGPTIGGVVVQVVGWRGIFLINVPFILIALCCCWHLLDFRQAEGAAKIDFLGSFWSMIVLFSLTLVLVKGSDWGWLNFRILALIILSCVALILFVLTECRVEQPMVPLSLFKNRQFVGASIVTIISGIFLVAVLVLLPSYFTKVQNQSELLAASQSVIGVFRQIGTSLAVAIFVTALSTNLVNAKQSVWQQSQQEINQLVLPKEVKQQTLAQVERQIFSTQQVSQRKTHGQFISQVQEHQLVQQRYQQVVKQEHLTKQPKKAKLTVYRQIETEVSKKVQEINLQLAQSVKKIKLQMKTALTFAFKKPYQVALPFTFLLLVCVSLFDAKSIKQE